MKVIACVPVRNEGWILELFLSALERIADVIVVADQGSDDDTAAICSIYSKALVVQNRSKLYDEAHRSQLLLDTARDFDGNNLIIVLDADELFSGDILDKHTIEAIADTLKPAESAELQWIWLWKAIGVFRSDGQAFGSNWKPFIFRDDRCDRFDSGIIHQQRVPSRAAAHRIRLNNPKVLHYQFAHWERALAKQRWYRCIERLTFPMKSVADINSTYAWFLYGWSRPQLREVPQVWLQPWLEVSVDPNNFRRQDIFWYELEVLQLFARDGLAPFVDLDIWDTDWEARRQVALQAGCAGLPSVPIADPRSREQRLAHAFTRTTLLAPPWRPLASLTRAFDRRPKPPGR